MLIGRTLHAKTSRCALYDVHVHAQLHGEEGGLSAAAAVDEGQVGVAQLDAPALVVGRHGGLGSVKLKAGVPRTATGD